jgi:hypothetical protein
VMLGVVSEEHQGGVFICNLRPEEGEVEISHGFEV